MCPAITRLCIVASVGSETNGVIPEMIYCAFSSDSEYGFMNGWPTWSAIIPKEYTSLASVKSDVLLSDHASGAEYRQVPLAYVVLPFLPTRFDRPKS